MPNQSNYIGLNGLVIQSYDEILAQLQTQWQGIYGADVNLESNSPDGQLLAIWAQEKADFLDMFVTLYNNLDPERAIGIPQQILYKLNNIYIKSYQYSYTYVNVTTSGAVTLNGLDNNINNPDGSGFTVSDTNGNLWILADTQNITAAGTYLLNFRAGNIGQIQASANSITVLQTILPNVSGVTNPAPTYITGSTGESYAEFSNRRARSLAAPSQGFDESIEGQILALEDVTQCIVYDNRTNEEVNGIPPHTVWVIVQGGSSSAIGQVIYDNIPPGIPMKGQQQVLITTPTGRTETVFYDVPTPVPLYVRATFHNLTNYPIDVNYIAEQLENTETFTIGQMAENGAMTAAIKNILGDQGVVYNVQLSSNGSDWVEYITPANLDEFFYIAADNVTFTID